MNTPNDPRIFEVVEPRLAARGHQEHATNEGSAGRKTKYRATQACQYCRMRKVRCDVLINKGGCTNCQLDHRRCMVPVSRRGRTHRGPGGSVNKAPRSPRTQLPRSGGDRYPATQGDSSRTDHRATSMPLDSTITGDVPVCVTFDRDDEHVDSERNIMDGEFSIHTTSQGVHDGTGFATVPLQRCASPVEKVPLPAFIAPLPSRICGEDLAFLTQKGAFKMPDPELRNEILRGYIFCTHPFMPILDLRPLVESIIYDREDGGISLLLFQAVMFAGVSSLQPSFVHRLGFKSVKDAREVFFTRVKLLFDFDIEQDSVAVLQSLLLMSSWYSKWNDWKDSWYWTGVALTVAQNMGLQREPTPACGNIKIQRFRRRLWWSLYIRDRMLALGTRRPMRIRDDSFDVTMLTLQDFDVEELNGLPLTPDSEEQIRTALMCIELAKLCGCIGNVLSAQYTTLSTQDNVAHKTMVVPKRDGHVGELENCDREINEWSQNLDPNLSERGPKPPPDHPSSCSEVHWAMLSLAHLTLLNVLHRTLALEPLSQSLKAQNIHQMSRLKVQHAARNVTKITQTMLYRDQVRFLGLNGITAILAACLSHMVDTRSSDEDIRDASTFRLCQSWQVLQPMRSMYVTADAADSFLMSVVRKARLSVPSQAPSPGIHGIPNPAVGQLQSALPENVCATDSPSTKSRRSALPAISSDTCQASWQGSSTRASSFPQSVYTFDSDRQSLLSSSEMQTAPLTMTATVDSSVTTNALISDQTRTTGPRQTLSRNQRDVNSADTLSQQLVNSVTNDLRLDWNRGLDNFVDSDFVAYNYDFISDTFGFFNDQLKGI